MINYREILHLISQKNVELRHDVDISLVSAYNIAKVEKEFGIKSIFYLRFDSDYYNMLSIHNEKIISFLIDNHEIGCHVDCSEIEDLNGLYEYLKKYSKILDFQKFTFHINTEKTKSFSEVDGFINKSILYGEYISDSKNFISEKDIQRMKILDEYTLLLHPEWWDNEKMEISNGYRSLIKSLRFDDISHSALKEILNYE